MYVRAQLGGHVIHGDKARDGLFQSICKCPFPHALDASSVVTHTRALIVCVCVCEQPSALEQHAPQSAA